MSEEVRVMSGVPQDSILGPHLFLMHVNDIWRNLESTIKLFTKDCIIYMKIMNESDIHAADRSGQIWGVGGRKCDENKSR